MTDRHYKSVKELLNLLVKDAGYGANLLLNIGPLPNGEIQPEFTERLIAMGNWLKINGETIYGTRAGFIKPQDWGVVTEKPNKLYLHVFKTDDNKIFLKVPGKIKSAKLFAGKKTISWQQLSDNYVMVNLPPGPLDDIDTIIEIDWQKS